MNSRKKKGRKPLPYKNRAVTYRLREGNALAVKLLSKGNKISQGKLIDKCLEFAMNHPDFKI